MADLSVPNPNAVQEFEDALEALLTADSQNNAKGNKIKQWFLDYFSGAAAVSFIRGQNQIGNRFKEQKGKSAPYTIFLFTDENILNNAVRKIDEYVYPEAKSIYFILKNDSYILHTIISKTGAGDPILKILAGAFKADVAKIEALRDVPTVGTEVVADAVSRHPDFEIEWPTVPLPNLNLLGMEKAILQIFASMKAGKHILLVGPPGVAKTELSEYICSLCATPYRITTATSEWTTADTIGTYVTNFQDGHAGQLDFELGVVTDSISRNEWLIIDEFNRANIDRAFGELFTVLTGQTIVLPFKKWTENGPARVSIGRAQKRPEDYHVWVSPSWRIIATMNSVDKASLSRLSLALIRRFAVIHIGLPQPSDYRKILERQIDAYSTRLAQPIIETVLLKISRIFADGEVAVLSKVGLEIGPAIAMDVMGYVIQRLLNSAELGVDPLIWEALAAYLFPQMEGRDDIHASLIENLSAVLASAEGEREGASAMLAVFTGFRP
jgi:MoxR-like ATPase